MKNRSQIILDEDLKELNYKVSGTNTKLVQEQIAYEKEQFDNQNYPDVMQFLYDRKFSTKLFVASNDK